MTRRTCPPLGLNNSAIGGDQRPAAGLTRILPLVFRRQTLPRLQLGGVFIWVTKKSGPLPFACLLALQSQDEGRLSILPHALQRDTVRR
jgi:hypothetical protein